MSRLSSDLIVNILSKLPVKSLCRFRCVSKSFYNLLTDPRFAKLHLTQTQTRKLVLNTSCSSLYFVDFERSYNDHKLAGVKLEHFPIEKVAVTLLGSCDGLLMLKITEISPAILIFFLLYNPSTRESKKIPDFPSNYCSLYGCRSLLTGFGYAKSSDDYRFVKVIESTYPMHVFSLRNNSWKILKNDLPGVFQCFETLEFGALYKGAIHWAFPEAIGAFDLDEEKCKTLPIPDGIFENMENYIFYSVGVVGDCLCMLYQRSRQFRYELYIMKEYGVKDSWNRIYIEDQPYCLLWPPLSFGENKEGVRLVAMHTYSNMYRTSLVRYHDGRYKEIEIDYIPKAMIKNASVYVESIVSPNYI